MSARELESLLGDKRSMRSRKVSERMAVVGENERRAAIEARLEALENDNAALDQFGADESDDEFAMTVDEDGNEIEAPGGKRKKGAARRSGVGTARRTRGKVTGRGPRTFQMVLEEAGLEGYSEPNYLAAAAGPPVAYAPRKFCSVCSMVAAYTCVRCGARYCSQRCYGTHSDTRCLKFMA